MKKLVALLLFIISPAYAAGGVYCDGSSNCQLLSSGTPTKLTLPSGTHSLAPLDGPLFTGNVGIGTATPLNSESLTVNGTLGFVATSTQGIVGTTTNDSAATGNVGEYVSSYVGSGSSVSLTSGSAVNITSISLTAGDWDVRGNCIFQGAATTVLNQYFAGISTTSNTFDYTANRYTGAYQGAAIFSSVSPVMHVPPTRLSLSSTTTVYQVCTATFTTSTASAYGGIYARRVR